MGNKHGTYDSLLDETKQLLMERTGKNINISFSKYSSEGYL